MKIINHSFHTSQDARCHAYEFDNGIEFVRWSNGLKYAYKGSRLLTEAETNAVEKDFDAFIKDMQERAMIERDLRIERCD